MTRGDEVPEWAKKRACEEANNVDDAAFIPEDCGFGPLLAFARYIAEREVPPVDPLREEVQTLADAFNKNLSAMPWLEEGLRAALRRGMELAKERQP